MRRLFFALVILWQLSARADAACSSLPYTFTNTTSTVDAGTTNANNNHLQSCVTSVDSTQIGTAGLTAANLLPTTSAAATFGGTQQYIFPAGITAGGPLSATTGTYSGALTATGYSGGTISGTTGTFSGAVTATGYSGGPFSGTTGTFTGAITGASYAGGNVLGSSAIFTGTINGATVTGTNGSFTNTSAGALTATTLTALGLSNLNAGVNTTFMAATGGVTGATIAAGTTGYITSGATSGTSGYVPPVFTASGAATSSSDHLVRGIASLAVSAGDAAESLTVTLSGAAAFSNGTSYSVVGTYDSGSTSATPLVYLKITKVSGTQFTVLVSPNLGGTFSGSGAGPILVNWIASGN